MDLEVFHELNATINALPAALKSMLLEPLQHLIMRRGLRQFDMIVIIFADNRKAYI
jgi:hypothetical protein